MLDPRTEWIAATTAILRRHSFVVGVWLVGSFARGTADDYSDIDLVAAVDANAPERVLAEPFTGLGLPGAVLFTRPKPRNAPVGGAYLAICLDLGGLPVLVDLFVWPIETAAVPVGGRVVYARSELAVSDLEFIPLIDRHRTTDTTGADPGHPATVLLLVLLAAKYHARRDRTRLAGIHRQLHIPEDAGPPTLHEVIDQRVNLDAWPQFALAVSAAHRLVRHAASIRSASPD